MSHWRLSSIVTDWFGASSWPSPYESMSPLIQCLLSPTNQVIPTHRKIGISPRHITANTFSCWRRQRETGNSRIGWTMLVPLLCIKTISTTKLEKHGASKNKKSRPEQKYFAFCRDVEQSLMVNKQNKWEQTRKPGKAHTRARARLTSDSIR